MGIAYPDYSGDHAFVSGTETLTLTKAADGAVLNAAVGKKGSITVSDIQAGGALGVSPSDCVFVIWLATISNYRPVNGDRLTRTSPAETWTVISESIRSDDKQVRLVCRKARANTTT